MHIWTLLLASGHGTRIQGQNARKQFLPWKERPLYWHSVLALAAVPAMRGIIVTFPEDEYQARGKELVELGQTDGLGLESLCCSGGPSRQESVAKALHQLPPECTHVLIHDAARPFVRPFLIQNIINSLASGSGAVVPALP
ncbi:MAG: 2-C-methyl-D-erythritol 4-phosphate cytidylyltransferase, partial [Desulfovermiculus sp.]|nr:2-C-methyl-D-erythritol 4-phosphate cytidylyltransferase [Desulfovermiculus sp.]